MTVKSAAERFWDVAVKLTVLAAAGTCGAVISHESRIGRLEADHFDSGTVLKSIDERLRAIEDAVTRLKTLHEIEGRK